jgi:hypothetical protein
MATQAEIQAELDSQGTKKIANITKSQWISSSVENFYVVGMNGYAGICRWVTCNPSEAAADQAADILTGLS